MFSNFDGDFKLIRCLPYIKYLNESELSQGLIPTCAERTKCTRNSKARQHQQMLIAEEKIKSYSDQSVLHEVPDSNGQLFPDD